MAMEIVRSDSDLPDRFNPNPDPFERLEDDVARGRDIYEAAVSLGISYADDLDDRRWKLARLASLVGKKYGEDILGDFASDVNESKKRLQEWRQVFNFYGPDLLAHWQQFPILRYTHFRLAMRIAAKTEDADKARSFLQECVEGDWRAGRAEAEADKWLGGGSSTPLKLGETTATITAVKGKTVTLKVSNELIVQVCEELVRTGKEALVKFFEAELPPGVVSNVPMDEQAQQAR